MDTAQWPQEIVVKPIEEIVTNTCPKPNNNNNNNNTLERKLARPQKEQALNCPRCNSTNTKFCYYNNYSLTQPRYFCKTCRRYWTAGGSLRNIPVGGGSRKNKRPSSSSSSSLSSQSTTTITNSSSAKAMTTKLPDLIIHPSNSTTATTTTTNQAQKIMMINQGQDLNLGFPSSITNTPHHQDFRNISDLVQLPSLESSNKNSANNNNHHHISALELLTGLTSRGFNSFMPMPVLVPDHHHHQHPNTVYGNTTTTSTSTTTTTNNTSSGFSLIPHEFKPSLNFSLDGLGSGNGGYESLQAVQEAGSGTANNGRLLFPFEDLKQVSAGSNGIDHNNKDQGDSANGYWTGMLGGGSW